jgi:hypothetical protein
VVESCCIYLLLVLVHKTAPLTCEAGRDVCNGTGARRGRHLILMISVPFKKRVASFFESATDQAAER